MNEKIIECVEFAYNNFKEFEEFSDFKTSYEELGTLIKIFYMEKEINKLKKSLEDN